MKIIDLILNEITCKTYRHVHGNSLYQIFTEKGNYYIYLKKITPAYLPHNKDITRIQIPNLPAFDEVIKSELLFFAIGYDTVNNVYAVWNPKAVKSRLNRKTNISLYSTYKGQQEVRTSQKLFHYESKQRQDVVIVTLSGLQTVLFNYSLFFNAIETTDQNDMKNTNKNTEYETPYIDSNGKLTKITNPELLTLLKPCFASPYPTYVQAYNIIEDFYGMDRFPKMEFKDWEYLLTHIDWNNTNNRISTERKEKKTKKRLRRRWTNEEMILVLDLYYKLPFSKFSSRTPEIQKLALKTGRSASSITMRLCNYEYIRTGRGLSGGQKQCLPFLDKYKNDRSQLKQDAEYILANYSEHSSVQPNLESKSKKGGTYEDFWRLFIKYNQKHNGPYALSKGTPYKWLCKSCLGINGVNINVVIGNKSCRSEIYINTGNKDENKRIFDFYYSYRKKIEKFIKDLTWERLDDKNTCRIKIEKPLSFRNSDDCEKIFNFFVTSTEQYLKVFAPYSSKYKNNNILEFPNLFSPSTGLCVFLPDGNVIQEKKACDTFIKAILLAGVHKVRKLGYTYCRVPIVSNTKDRKYGSAQHPIGGGLYILTHSNSKDKKRILDRISEELNLNWRVEIIE